MSRPRRRDEAPQAELKPLSGGKPMADIAL